MPSIPTKGQYKPGKLCTNGVKDDPNWHVCSEPDCTRKTRYKTGKKCHYHMCKASELKNPEYYRLAKLVAHDRWLARGRKKKNAA